LALTVFLLLPAPPGGVPPPLDRAAAAPVVAGVHAPNRAWTGDDFGRVAAGAFGAVKLMSYHPPEAYERLLHINPQMAFAVRLDTPWHELPDPEWFVAAHAPYLTSLVQGGYELWVEIGNEPNLELHPLAEHAFASWYADVLSRLRASVPRARFGYPGLAPDRREDAWIAASAPAIGASDWIGAHAYWVDEREMLDPRRALRFVDLHRRFPHLPILVTEAGSTRADLPSSARAAQYATFVRAVARLPYVRAVFFFILSGTPEWQQFFFDDTMLGAVRGAAREPVLVLDGVAGAAHSGRRAVGQVVGALVGPYAGGATAAHPVSTAAPRLSQPTPHPSARRLLLSDPDPLARSGAGSRPDLSGPQWVRLASSPAPVSLPVPYAPTDDGHRAPGERGASPPCPPGWDQPLPAARTAGAYLATHLSAKIDLAPPVAGRPFALQIADQDAFGADDGVTPSRIQAPPSTGFAPSRIQAPPSTGFTLLWDGAAWRLQYRRAGQLAVDAQLAGLPAGASGVRESAETAPAVPDGRPGELGATVEGAAPAGRATAVFGAAGDASPSSDWYTVEVALEPRSAAAWVWPRGAPQPDEPNVVFAPPEEAAADGARPRYLYLPAHRVANLVLEGTTRD
jgi:hypothetical protein